MESETFQDIFTITSIAVHVLTIVGLIYIFIQVRKLLPLLAAGYAVNNVPTVEAAKLAHNFVFQNLSSTTTTVKPKSLDDDGVFSGYYTIMVILSLCAFVLSCVQFVHFLTRVSVQFPRILQCLRERLGPLQRTNNVRLYLKVANESEKYLLYLDTLNSEPIVLAFSLAPQITNFRLQQSCLKTKLVVSWDSRL